MSKVRTSVRKSMVGQRKVFSIEGDNRGLSCPFKAMVCGEGYCSKCQVYSDWEKLGEMLVVCSWCGKAMYTKPGLGQVGVSHGLCSECQRKYESG